MKKLHFIVRQASRIGDLHRHLASVYDIGSSSRLPTALEALRHRRPEFVFLDIQILQQAASESSYKAVFQTIGLVCPNVSIIVLAPSELIAEAVKIVHEGAETYLTYPLVPDEIGLVVSSIIEQNRAESELKYLREQVWQENEFDLLYSKSPAMKAVFEKIRAVASTKSTVLLTGETGTGKGFTARFIHKLSLRKDERFIEVHCGAIPDTLVESEMFGHEKGAFTGAVRRKLGKFEIAKNGTIFLDEIGTITPPAQIKLLQVLQDGTFHRVGGEEQIQADVRIIAATNADLKQLCDERLFRSDLFYRLNVFPVALPSLKERKEDIPQLAEAFLGRLNTFHSKAISDVHPQVLEAFLAYSWPGNIRELENVLERAYILEKTSVLRPENFPAELFAHKTEVLPGAIDLDLSLAQVRAREAARVERRYLDLMLARCRGKINDTAHASGITTRQLHKLMKRHSLVKEDYKNNS
ncbi:sigma-54 dependent transcriptional regulator [uncultured Desulfobacter sp.]|uniref:sigma-54 dependent transcriptional regulator n=1 Tax=uncultured Desulfobacter sp. TaxID=240139 RepID=UPI002AAA7E6A|nr:sigma-54 dependent transcriptional regulator [uncultured Desulfobacter sp.]